MSLLERVVDGEISLHEIEEHLSGEDVADEAADLRREAVEHRTDTDLNGLADPSFDMGDVSDRNVENLVGRIEVPVGVVGPIEVDGEDAEGEYHVPVATTEGALVASVNRGCSAVCDAGGVDSVVVKDAMTRAPVFKTSGVRESRKLALWVEDNLDRLIEASESTTDHGELLWIDPYVAGDNVYLRMGFDTKDAMGMNMATIAAKEACELIEEAKYPDCRLVALSGNLCSDKKPAAINAVEGRGKTVTADATIPAPLVERKLKTSVEDFLEVHERKTMVGSTRAGILGANAHVANILSSIYLATGQDVAQVVEGSSGITTCSEKDGDLYVSLTLPSVEVGTVGGGTGIEGQRSCLEMLGVSGGGDPEGSNAKELAEVIGGVALAGEVSLHAALSARHLSGSHDELGR